MHVIVDLFTSQIGNLGNQQLTTTTRKGSMPAKRPLSVSSSRINIEQDEDDLAFLKVIDLSERRLTKKRAVEDKENRTRPAGKKIVKERKTSSTLTSMYSEDDGTSSVHLPI
jgi:hypothetical protein